MKEELATRYLQDKGYVILERNFTCRSGEIDIIAKKDECVIFVEVKYRSSDRYGMPYESVDYKKRQRIVTTSKYYIMTRNLYNIDLRYDVISILGNNVSHYENAF